MNQFAGAMALTALRILVLAWLLLCVPSAQAEETTQTGPEVRVADNVYLVPDARAKALTGWLVVKAGYADEGTACTGIAHYLEHLLFINRDADNKAKSVAFTGGQGNGWTDQKSTVYYQRVPATDDDSLDKLVAYLSTLLEAVKSDEAQARRERNIVMQEYQLRVARSSYARFVTSLRKELLPSDPLGRCDIGTAESISAFTVDAARKFHEQWYVRNNAVLVLHGPADPEKLKPILQKHFFRIPERTHQTHAWALHRDIEPRIDTIRVKDKDARQTGVYVYKLVAYVEPPMRADARPLNTARGAISSFLTSKLTGSPAEALLDKGLVTSFGMSVTKLRAGTLQVAFWGAPAAGVGPEAVANAARTYIDKLDSFDFSQSLLDRLRNRSTTARELQKQEPFKYAIALQQWFAGHDAYDYWLDLENVRARTTVVHVRTILSAMAGPGRVVVGIIEPDGPVDAGTPASIPGPAGESANEPQ